MRPVGQATIEITVEEHEGAVIVHVRGEVDIATAPRLKEELTRLVAQGRPVIVDAGGIAYFDLAGVRALEAVDGVAMGNGIRVSLAGASRAVIRILDIVWPNGSMAVYDSVDEAVRHVTGGPQVP